MAMNSSSLASLILITAYSVIALLFLSPAHCLIQTHPSADTTQGLLVEEKSRLGSTPPSCHNKCNQCHPCMAVQVPTMPSHQRLRPYSGRRAKTLDYFDSSPSSNRYSNYKPLGWKCRCGGHLYNP